ncbi:tetratricopeptide repeat protein [Synechocystis salina LEGE 06155]|nr:tetratricopeptide repeat protein [Synechocystis salina LEGE 06155]
MTESLPIVYLSVLLIILGGLGVFVFSQVLKARRLENTFGKLQKKLQNSKGSAQEYYQLGSIYLDKKLYSQSINLFQKALKMAAEVEPENQALIYNAMGYACFAQEQFDLAIRHYKDALKLYPDYVIALNNLANVYEKKQMVNKALETYEETLAIEPNNKVAQRRANSLKKRLVET